MDLIATASAERASGGLRRFTDAPTLAAFIGRDHLYQFANEAYGAWFGLEPAEVVGRSVQEVLGAEGFSRIQTYLEIALSGGSVTFETEMMFRSGAPRRVKATYAGRNGPDGEPLGCFVLVEDLTGRRRAEEAATAILDGMADAFMALDAEWRLTEFNAPAQRMYGKARAEVIGRDARNVWPEFAGSEPAALISQVLRSRRALRREVASAALPGREFLMDAVPLTLGGVGVVLQDITERRAVEAQLAASEARFRNVVAVVPGLLFVSDANGANTFVNAEFARYTGQAEAELLGSGWIDTLHPDDRERAASAWAAAVSSGGPYREEYRFRSASGEYRWFICHSAPHRDESGGIIQWAGVGIDIEDSKRTEQRLIETGELISSVIEASPDPIFAKDMEGRWLLANSATADALGTAGEKLIGKRDRDLMDPELAAVIEAHDARVLAGEKLVAEEVVEKLGPATRVHQVTKAQLVSAGGAVRGLVGVARDITELKDAERRQRVLVDELNHRVKNTLAIVQALAQVTLRYGVDAVTRDAFQERIHALARAHDVLTGSDWETVFLREVVRTSLEPFVGTAGERISIEGPDLRLGARHSVAIAMALHELATNATKYGALSAETGRVSIYWWFTRDGLDPVMKLFWRESGGPPVRAPTRRGFGSRLIEQALPRDLNGRARISYLEGGLTCEIIAPLPYRPAAATVPSGYAH